MSTETAGERGTLTKLADELAPRVRWDSSTTWDDLRAAVDLRTGGDLDCVPLDILTDMVAARIKRETGHTITGFTGAPSQPTPRRRQITGRSALRVQPEQTTNPQREF